MIAAPPRGDRRERLGAHVDGYPARVLEALTDTYPVVLHLIGHRASHELVARYTPALIQHSYNLNDIGAELPRFIGGDVLADLARLEWAVARAFNAHDLPPLDPQPLANWTDEQWQHAVLHFQPSLALLSSPWPIRELWEARNTPIEAIDIDLRNRPDQVVVRRAGYDVRCESVGDKEALVLEALLAGSTLGDVSALLDVNAGDPESVAMWFARWMQNRLIVDCTSAQR